MLARRRLRLVQTPWFSCCAPWPKGRYVKLAPYDPDVRFGSKADMCSAKRHVRFTPKSGHVQRTGACPLCANSGHQLKLFDYLVSARKHRRWNCKTKRFLGVKINHGLKFGRLLYRQVAGLLAS